MYLHSNVMQTSIKMLVPILYNHFFPEKYLRKPSFSFVNCHLVTLFLRNVGDIYIRRLLIYLMIFFCILLVSVAKIKMPSP